MRPCWVGELLLRKGADASVKACAVKLPLYWAMVTDRLMKILDYVMRTQMEWV